MADMETTVKIRANQAASRVLVMEMVSVQAAAKMDFGRLTVLESALMDAQVPAIRV